MDELTTSIKTPHQLRVACTAFYFISGFGYSTWASRIPTIKHALNLNEAQLGSVLFAMPIGLLLTMPVTNRLLTKYTSRAVILFGSVFLCVNLVIIGYSNAVWQLVIMLFCFGSARNLMTLSINTQGVAIQALYSKSIMATFHGIWSLAGFAGAAVAYLMVFFNIGVHYHFLFVSIGLFMITFYFIKNTIDQKPIPQSRKPIFSLPDKYLINFSLICFASMACENAIYDWGAIYFQKAVHTEKATATAAFVIYMVAMTTGRFVGDRLVTRLGIKTVLRFSGIFIFCGLLLAVILPYQIPAAIGFMLTGLGVSCVVPMVFSLAGKSKTMSSSSALASISTIGYAGFLVVPPFVGYIAHASSIRLSFGVIALFGAMIVLLVSKLKDDDKQPGDDAVLLPED
ncbi:MAG: MFS transporter [Bacteroidota bacterium]|nr:MFS transporter [Bacteroidota bacterium]